MRDRETLAFRDLEERVKAEITARQLAGTVDPANKTHSFSVDANNVTVFIDGDKHFEFNVLEPIGGQEAFDKAGALKLKNDNKDHEEGRRVAEKMKSQRK